MAQSLFDTLQAFDESLSVCPLGSQRIPAFEAVGRVLAKNLCATHDSPPFTNSAMDGFGYRHADFTGTSAQAVIAGNAFAGHPFHGEIGCGEVIRIMTGALVPAGIDTVIPLEYVTVNDNTITFDPSAFDQGANIRVQGELFKTGDVLVHAGRQLTQGAVALANSLGFAELEVFRRIRVGVFASGDELVEPDQGQPLPEGKIYNSNSHMIALLAHHWGAEVVPLGILPDDPEVLFEKLSQASQELDLLVTTGGVGPGDKDFTSQVLSQLAHIRDFVSRMKPGKAIVFGPFKANTCFFIGLPGNPSAAAMSARLYLHRALMRLQGLPLTSRLLKAHLTTSIKSRVGRLEVLHGHISTSGSGDLLFTPHVGRNSAQLLGLVEATHIGFIEEDVKKAQVGDVITLWPL